MDDWKKHVRVDYKKHDPPPLMNEWQMAFVDNKAEKEKSKKQ